MCLTAVHFLIIAHHLTEVYAFSPLTPKPSRKNDTIMELLCHADRSTMDTSLTRIRLYSNMAECLTVEFLRLLSLQ